MQTILLFGECTGRTNLVHLISRTIKYLEFSIRKYLYRNSVMVLARYFGPNESNIYWWYPYLFSFFILFLHIKPVSRTLFRHKPVLSLTFEIKTKWLSLDYLTGPLDTAMTLRLHLSRSCEIRALVWLILKQGRNRYGAPKNNYGGSMKMTLWDKATNWFYEILIGIFP